jgi:hypothetical protein
MHRAWVLVAALGLLAGIACSSAPPLADTSASSEALAAAVLDALARDDRARLDAVALTEREFRDHVWPDLPAARPERNLPFSYVWGDLHQKSNLSLARTLMGQRGKRHTLQRVTFAGTTNYANYVVHREAKFVVTDPSGASTELRVCGSFIEKDGGWKVFSYVVDDD